MLVRRLITGKVVSAYEQYVGPKSKEHHLYPEFPTFPIWRGLWFDDALSSPNSPVWYCGDVEGRLDGEFLCLLNVRFSRRDIDQLLLDSSGGLTLADHSRPSALEPPVVPVRAIEPKWHWDAAFAELIATANGADGLEAIAGFKGPNARGAQARIAEWFASYFSRTSECGDHPADSECRHRANLVLQALSGRSAGR